MDGRGRLAQSLTWFARWRARPRRTAIAHSGASLNAWPHDAHEPPARFGRTLQRWTIWLVRRRVPRGAGIALAATLIFSSIGYGVVKGEHIPTIVAAFNDARDALANAVGFRVTSIALSGERHVSREEIL